MKKLMTTAVLFSSLGMASMVNAKSCELEINSNDKMQFDQSELKVGADCSTVKLTLNHTGTMAKNVMGHNWVLSLSTDMQTIATAGMTAGLEKEYLPADQSQVIAATDVIGGGENTSITFDVSGLSADKEYTFFCSFPGHWSLMKGKFIIE